MCTLNCESRGSMGSLLLNVFQAHQSISVSLGSSFTDQSSTSLSRLETTQTQEVHPSIYQLSRLRLKWDIDKTTVVVVEMWAKLQWLGIKERERVKAVWGMRHFVKSCYSDWSFFFCGWVSAAVIIHINIDSQRYNSLNYMYGLTKVAYME